MNGALSLTLSFGVLAAGLIFAYGVWLDRRDIGRRAALGVLATAAFAAMLPFLIAQLAPGLAAYATRGLSGLFLLMAWSITGVCLAFLPWLVAGN
ncbi:hypothetical protein GO986_02895 [Deinococcus sp. HMF7620]|uniref:Uncharacterized protein n=1 Tax=Deinococcus arboris TaxID=2682977 RepID=A0A7C9I8N7_9DEIO|nr:hypothetical protein [Deinococcus arboris]MVN85706.1 hypothetical protein [Deinococcus arboris]